MTIDYEQLDKEAGVGRKVLDYKLLDKEAGVDYEALDKEAGVAVKEPLSLEPTVEDLGKYRTMGVKQHRSSSGKLYDLSEKPIQPAPTMTQIPKGVGMEGIKLDWAPAHELRRGPTIGIGERPRVKPKQKEPESSDFIDDIKTVGQAAKIILDQPLQKGEIQARLKNIVTRAISPLALIIPGVSRKELIRELDEEAETFTGFGPALVPAAGETAELAVEWASFQKLFGITHKGFTALGKMQRVKKIGEAIKSLKGVNAFAKRFPRIYAANRDLVRAFAEGETLGQTIGLLEGLDEGENAGNILKIMNIRGGQLGAIAGTFSLASSIDTARYVSKFRIALMKNVRARTDAKLKSLRVKMPHDLPEGVKLKPGTEISSGRIRGLGMADPRARMLITQENLELQQVDNIVAAVEAELIGLKKGKLFREGQGAVESPQAAAKRIAGKGIDFSKPSIKGPAALKKGLGKPTAKKPLLPTTRAGEITERVGEIGKAIAHPVKTAKGVVARGKPPVFKPTKAPTARPAAAPVAERPAKAIMPPKAAEAVTEGKVVLPEHLQKIADKQIESKKDFVITDVTPEGFGPGEAVEPIPSTQLTTEQKRLVSTINEAKTILKGDVSGEKRAAIERSLAKAEKKLEALSQPPEAVTEGKAEIKEAESRFIALTRAPTPVKDRLKISTLQFLRNQHRVNILSDEVYLAKLNKHTKFKTEPPVKTGKAVKLITEKDLDIEHLKTEKKKGVFGATGYELFRFTLPNGRKFSIVRIGREWSIQGYKVDEVNYGKDKFQLVYNDTSRKKQIQKIIDAYNAGFFAEAVTEGKVIRKSSERIEKEVRDKIITPQQAIDELLIKQKEIETNPKNKLPKGGFRIYTKAAEKKLDEIGWAITRQKAKIKKVPITKPVTEPPVKAAKVEKKVKPKAGLEAIAEKLPPAKKTGIERITGKEKAVTGKIKPARLDELVAKGEIGEVELEPASKSPAFNKHIEYFETRQLPADSRIPEIQRKIRQINGQRLAGKITPARANSLIKAWRNNLLIRAQKEGVALRSTKGGKVTPAVRKAGTYVPEEFSQYGKFKNIRPRFQDVTRSIQQIDGALKVKEKVQTKGQAGAAERHILWPTREMHIQKEKYVNEKLLVLEKIIPAKEGSKEDKQLNIVLEKISKEDRNRPIKDILNVKTIKAMGVKPSAVNQAIRLRKFYDDLIEEQNFMRDVREQPPIPYRHKYSPHILRDATVWEKVSMIGKEPPAVFKKGTDLPDYIKPNKPFNPREMAREAGIPYDKRIKSAKKLARMYLATAAKDIFNTSIIQNNKAFIQQLETMGYDKPARFLADWTAEAYAGITPSFDRSLLLSETPKIKREMSRFNRARNLAVFPLNVAWSLGTQIKSLALTIGRYGSVNTTRGFYQWLQPSTRKQATQEYYSYIVKSAKQGRITRQDADNLIGETVKLRRTKPEMARDLTTLFLEQLEKLLTGTSIRAAHLHGVKRGLKGDALKNYASDGGAKTQSMYNDEDKPAFLRNLTVKTIAPYQTYTYEVMNTLREWAGRTGTPPDSKMYAIWSMVRFMAAMVVLNMIEAEVRGRKWSWFRLVPVPFSEFWLSPIVKHFTNEWIGGGSGLASPVDVASRLGKGVEDVLETGSWRKLRNQLITYGPGYGGIPGGVQWMRMVDSIIAYSQGGVKDRRGKMLFKMEDPQDLIRGIFTGVWTTKGGREYLEKRMGKKPAEEKGQISRKILERKPMERKVLERKVLERK